MRAIAIAIAALLVTSCQAPLRTAHAGETDTWDLRTRFCTVVRLARSENLRDDELDLQDLADLQKFIPRLRACEKFKQCVANRDAGKVKHCYWPRIL
jgi:hypothetical protein